MCPVRIIRNGEVAEMLLSACKPVRRFVVILVSSLCCVGYGNW
jgi:hypothetical protein